MKRMFLLGLALVLTSLSHLSAISASEEVTLLPKPAYKLYTISSKKIRMTDEDVACLADNFEFIHGKLSPQQFDAIRKLNPDFKCLIYVNSTYTRAAEEVGPVERQYRDSLCMHLAATLVDPLDASQNTFRVASTEGARKRGRDDGMIPIRASTIEGDFSPSDDTSTKRYVFWIRIGDELMRVNAFDRERGEVTVVRGFSGTKPAAHAAGAKVFSPVYLGFRRTDKNKYPGLHPEGPGDRLRYVFDPNRPAGYAFLSDLIVKKMQEERADGVWLDTLNTGDFNLSDCLGRPVRPWNFAKDEVCSYEDFRKGQERKIAWVQEDVRKRVGRYPFLAANNLKPTTYYPGSGGMRQLLVSTEALPRPLDAFCMEGGLAWRQAHDEAEYLGWKERVQILMDAAQNGLAAAPVLAGAGAKSFRSEPDTPQRDRAERFGYASYLLGVEKDGPTYMGTYAFYRDGEKRFAKLHRQYFYPIGDPVETVAPQEIEKYRVAGTPVYRRNFTGGVVLVNPSNQPGVVKLERPCLDPDSGERITEVKLPAGVGRILLYPKSGEKS